MNDKQKLIFLEKKVEILEEFVKEVVISIKSETENDKLFNFLDSDNEDYEEKILKLKLKQEN